MLIQNFLENSAARYPDKIAVIHDDHRVSYFQLNAWADNLATHLQATGITKGDRIALHLENSADYIVAYYATLKAGAVVAPLNPGLKPDGLQYLLNDLEPSAIITNFKAERLLKATKLDHLGLKALVIRTPKQGWTGTPYKVLTLEETTTNPTSPTSPSTQDNPITTPDNLSSIIYTSGSTGEPKGVMLSHKNIVCNTNSICQSLDIRQTDIQMVVLPFFYVMGKSLLNTHITAGATVVLNNRFMYPAGVVNQMIDEGVTSFSGVPSTYAYLLHRSPLASCRDKLTTLRYCSQAGGHMAKALKLALRKTLPVHTKIYIMYGATEAAARLTCLDAAHFESKMGSIGRPIPDVTLRVLDERDQEVPNGTEGTLVSSGPNIMLGYWKAPQDSARTLTLSGYHTGDLGHRDEEGFFYVTGRKDGLLKVSGHRINPTEIEDFLMVTDMLIEAAVIGMPDELKGKKLIALVVPKNDSLNPQTLLEACATGLPKHKLPAEIITTPVLPKNASGKIDRQACINLLTQKSK
jgi:acyl-CoA synthetase (AMP-forming)/AMP-acid ligase II